AGHGAGPLVEFQHDFPQLRSQAVLSAPSAEPAVLLLPDAVAGHPAEPLAAVASGPPCQTRLAMAPDTGDICRADPRLDPLVGALGLAAQFLLEGISTELSCRSGALLSARPL